MTTDRDTLLALAARVEKATGADRELDAVICVVLGIEPQAREMLQFPAYDQCVRYFTASLDAAMSLMPEGYEWAAGTGRAQHMAANGRKPWAWCVSGEGFTIVERTILAATPALALTAAALRARAASLPVSGGGGSEAWSRTDPLPS